MRYPERVVCLTEETTETMYLLGAYDRVVGVSGFTMRPSHARRERPKISTFLEAKTDQIVGLHPDLVVGFSDLQAQIAKDLVERGLNVLVFNQRSLAEIYQFIATFGAMLGLQARALALVDALSRHVDAVRAFAEGRPRVRVYFEEWPDPMIRAIQWVSELIAVAGGEDVFASLPPGRSARERFVTGPEVVARDPEVIAASWCGKSVDIPSIANREGWGKMTAVVNARIEEIDSTYILQPGPAALTVGLRALFRVIHGTDLPATCVPDWPISIGEDNVAHGAFPG